MTFIKMAASAEEIYEVAESFGFVTERLKDDQRWVTLTTAIDGESGTNGLVCLNAAQIEAVWPS